MVGKSIGYCLHIIITHGIPSQTEDDFFTAAQLSCRICAAEWSVGYRGQVTQACTLSVTLNYSPSYKHVEGILWHPELSPSAQEHTQIIISSVNRSNAFDQKLPINRETTFQSNCFIEALFVICSFKTKSKWMKYK